MTANFRPGFYAAQTSHAWVFAFNGEDTVWLRTGMLEEDSPLNADFEEEWELPEDLEGVREFMKMYGFVKLTTKEAQPYIRKYLYHVIEILHPDSNKELAEDPNKVLDFVRLVKDFLYDLDQI